MERVGRRSVGADFHRWQGDSLAQRRRDAEKTAVQSHVGRPAQKKFRTEDTKRTEAGTSLQLILRMLLVSVKCPR